MKERKRREFVKGYSVKREDMKRYNVVFLLFVILIVFASQVAGFSRNGAKPPAVLYKSFEGWKITSYVSGRTLTDKYRMVLERMDNLPSSIAPPYMKYIYDKGPVYFYMFALEIPEGETIYWAPSSYMKLKYVAGKDTLSVTSSMIFFLSHDLKQMYFLHESSGYFAVPNPAIRLCVNQLIPVNSVACRADG